MSVLVKNTLYSALTNAIQFLTNIIILVLLARPLGAEEFGRLLLAMSFCSIFGILVEFGFTWYATKEVSQRPASARDIAGKVFNSQLVLGLGASVLVTVFVLILGYPLKTGIIICIIWMSTILSTLTDTLRSVFKGLNRFQFETLLNFILFAALLLLLGIFPLFHSGTVAFAGAILGARIVYFASGLFLFRKKIGRMKFDFDFKKGSELMKMTLSYGIQIILARLLLEWNTLVLYQYRGNYGVGIYQASLRFILASLMISDILLQAFFPVIASSVNADRPKFMKVATLLNRYLLTIGAFMTGFFFIFADILIKVIYGVQYLPAVPILKILAFAVWIKFLSSTQAIVLIASDRQDMRARASAMALFFNVLFAFTLIPRFGLQGAAYSTVASFLIVTVLYYFFVQKTIGRIFFDRRCLYSIVLVSIGSGITWVLKEKSLLLGIASYLILGVLLLLTATTQEEKSKMRNTLRIPSPE
jgi:O-antigen/teichoic acid export membrane protein